MGRGARNTTDQPREENESRAVRITVRLTRAARSHDTPERGHTGHARAGSVRRVQANVIRPVERARLTDNNARRGFRRSMHTQPRTPHAVPSHLHTPDHAVEGDAQRPDDATPACAESETRSVETTTGDRSSTRRPRRLVSTPLRVSLSRAMDPEARTTTDQPKRKTIHAPSV